MTGVLYVGDHVELPILERLYPYHEGEPTPRAEVMALWPVLVKIRWLDAVPRGHSWVETHPYRDLRRVDAASRSGPR